MPEHTPAPTPHRAIYGFAMFVFFLALLVFYYIWALVPDATLARLGLTSAPHKYFVLFIPVLVMFALTLFGWVVYPAMNLAITFDPDDARTLTDSCSIRRCQFVNVRNGRLCDKRVEPQPDSGWAIGSRCALHDEGRSRRSDASGCGGGEENEVQIEDFCDCVVRKECLLHREPGHVRRLLDRQMVASVGDLDVSEVCAKLFGGGGGGTGAGLVIE